MKELVIKDFCYISDGNYSSKYPRSDEFKEIGIPFIRANNLVNGTVVSDDMYFISPEKHSELRKGHLRTDDVLITTRGNIGQTAVVPAEFHDANINAQIVLLRVDKEKILPKYLEYALHTDTVVQQIESSITGTALKQLPVGRLEKIKVKIHPKNEQEHIVSVLQKIDVLTSAQKEQLETIETIVKSRFIELFDGKYETKPLQAVCEELFAGGDVKKDKSSDTQSEEYPYPIYTNGEKNNGLYGYTSIVRVAKEAVTISGRGTIGFTCLRKEPFYPAVRLIVAVPKQELVSGCYLQHFIQSKNYGGQGASIPQLTVPMIKDEPIPVPPIELQEQFAAFVEQTDKSKLAVQQSLEKLETLKKALMQKYFG